MTATMEIKRTHGGYLLVLPLPKKISIADDLLRDSINAGWVTRTGYWVTFGALNVHAIYRLGTLEQGCWTASLVEWRYT